MGDFISLFLQGQLYAAASIQPHTGNNAGEKIARLNKHGITTFSFDCEFFVVWLTQHCATLI